MSEIVGQDRAVAALVMILTEDLPQCSWIVFPDSGLEGWIADHGDSSFDGHEAIQAWAAKFGAGVNKVGKMLITYGAYAHVPVRILAKDSPR